MITTVSHLTSIAGLNDDGLFTLTALVLGAFEFHVAFRDELLVDRVSLFLKLIEPLLPSDAIEAFTRVSLKFIEVLYEDFHFVKDSTDLGLLASAGEKMISSILKLPAYLLNLFASYSPLVLRRDSHQMHRKHATDYETKYTYQIRSTEDTTTKQYPTQESSQEGLPQEVQSLTG